MAEWRDGGRTLTTAAGTVFVRSAPGDGPTLLLLHGYPSSSYDYRKVVPHLAGRAWLTLDFLGFGLSDKPRPHRYSLLEQADIVQTRRRRRPGPVVVDRPRMGTSVATELLARDLQGHLPFELQRAVLSNGSVILHRASLRPVQKMLRGPLGPLVARFANRGMFSRGFRRACSAEPPAVGGGGRRAVGADDVQRRASIAHLLISYLDERVRYARDGTARAGLAQAAGLPVGAG